MRNALHGGVVMAAAMLMIPVAQAAEIGGSNWVDSHDSSWEDTSRRDAWNASFDQRSLATRYQKVNNSGGWQSSALAGFARNSRRLPAPPGSYHKRRKPLSGSLLGKFSKFQQTEKSMFSQVKGSGQGF